MNWSSRSLKIWTDISLVLSQSTRLTDRRTGRILIARPCLHSMQRGKKMRVFNSTLLCSGHWLLYELLKQFNPSFWFSPLAEYCIAYCSLLTSCYTTPLHITRIIWYRTSCPVSTASGSLHLAWGVRPRRRVMSYWENVTGRSVSNSI